MSTRTHVKSNASSRNANDLRGLGRLAIDGVTGITDLVEAMHAAITHLPSALGRPAPASTTGLTGFVYQSVRTITGWVGDGVDASLTRLAPVLGDSGRGAQRDATLAAMNGVLGDYLEASANPLAITMQLCVDGEAVSLDRAPLATHFPDASGKLLVLVHGLCMNDLQWNYAGHDHGEALARDLGYSALYLHYNSGRHISTNGADFSAMLGQVATAWPVPLEEITLLGHSMGGLVIRSAIDHGFSHKRPWSELGIKAIFLGTPHHGAPLERAGSWADMLIGVSPYSAPFVRLGQMRSAGIQDLRHGNLRDADWQDRKGSGRADPRTPLPLPKEVTAYAVAASTQAKRKDADASHSRGDGLVPIASALGIHPDEDFDLRIPKARQWVGHGINHLQLLGNDAVYQQIKRWLR